MSDFNLERVRKEAKSLLRSCREGNPDALARVLAQLPGLNPETIQLADIHHAMAREHGFSNWAALKHDNQPLERFLHAIRSGAYREVRERIDQFQDFAADNIHAACSIGDARAAARHLDGNNSLATAEHNGWPPLFYACASPIHQLSSRHAAGILECATLLLDRGVDPNTSVLSDPSNPESRTSARFRALLSLNSPLQFLLVRRGANPRLDQSRAMLRMQPETTRAAMTGYFQKSFAAPEMREKFARRMAAAKADPDTASDFIALKNYYDRAFTAYSEFAAQGMEVMLQAGFDPNTVNGSDQSTSLHHMAERNADPGLAEIFLKHGANPNRPRADGRTPYMLAVRGGRRELANLMLAYGADNQSAGLSDRLVGACLRADGEAVHAILKQNSNIVGQLTPEDREALIEAAGRNDCAAIRVMADAGFDLGRPGESGSTALHVAAWHGYLEVVRLLLELGAPVDSLDSTFGLSPRAWAEHGSIHCRTAPDEYAAIRDALPVQGKR